MASSKKDKAKAQTISISAQEAARRIRAEFEAICQNPFCRNKRKHLVVSGKCIFTPKE